MLIAMPCSQSLFLQACSADSTVSSASALEPDLTWLDPARVMPCNPASTHKTY